MSLKEAKTYVDRNLSPEAQEANERLRDTAEAVLTAAGLVDEAHCVGLASGCPGEVEAFVVFIGLRQGS